MPELPEVETVRRGLAPVVEGRAISRIWHAALPLRKPWPRAFARRLRGRRIERLERRGKYLLWRLSGGLWIVSHLGMSGRFTILPARGQAQGLGEFYFQPASGPKRGPHDHLILTLDDGTRIVYADPRRFGFFELTEDPAAHPALTRLGPEPLGEDFDAAYLARVLRWRSAPVKSVLLDQRVVAGVGNIYACEALFLARISPRRAARSLSPSGRETPRLRRLVRALKRVLRDAIRAGGTTLRDYRRADGEAGEFQQKFCVYGRQGEPCPRRGCGGVIRRIEQAGRGTFYCPRCQR